MGAAKKRRRFLARAPFDQLDFTELSKLCNRAFRAGKQPDFKPPQRQIGGRGTAAITSAENRNFLNGH